MYCVVRDNVLNPQNKPYQVLFETFLRPQPRSEALDMLPLGLYRRHDGIGENYWFVLSLDACSEALDMLPLVLAVPGIAVCSVALMDMLHYDSASSHIVACGKRNVCRDVCSEFAMGCQ